MRIHEIVTDVQILLQGLNYRPYCYFQESSLKTTQLFMKPNTFKPILDSLIQVTAEGKLNSRGGLGERA